MRLTGWGRGGSALLDQYAERWALVTGASSGIGAEFARLLAARGMHLVLVARRTDRLNELAAELHARHRSNCEVISSDLADPREPAALFDQVTQRGITVELLVNNAGFAVVGEVEKTDTDRIDQMLRLNVITVTDLTYRFLPGMLARGHGAILNISSVAAFQPVAYMAAYAASKSYILNFTEALWAEVRDRGVSLMAVCPGTTRTELFDVAGVPGWLKRRPSQSAERVARGALRALEKRKQCYIPGWRNYLITMLVRMAPRSVVVKESMKYFRPGRTAPPSDPEIVHSVSDREIR
jgi:short-subunit dehydrogenase